MSFFLGIPGSKVDFLRFVQAVKKLRENIESPIAAHCRFALEHVSSFPCGLLSIRSILIIIMDVVVLKEKSDGGKESTLS